MIVDTVTTPGMGLGVGHASHNLSHWPTSKGLDGNRFASVNATARGKVFSVVPISLTRAFACVAVACAASPCEARFLQVDPVGYKDQVNLYAYVNNDPIDNRDPSGEKCVGEVGHMTCTFDAVRLDGGPKLTRQQVTAAKAFEARYTRDVNKLSTSNKMVTIAVKGHETFKISAKEVGASLATRTLTYAPRGSSGNALAVTGGSIFRPSTTVFESGLHQGSFTDTIIGHEGIHETLSEGQALAPSSLGVEPGRTDHQAPYNKAADDLLGPP